MFVRVGKWRKVGYDQRGPDECWPWRGSVKLPEGYGQCYNSRTKRLEGAHRVVYELLTGLIVPPNASRLEMHHTCHNPPCVNPAHLFEGTTQDNTADMMAKGRHNPIPRKAACKRGHPLSGDNLKVKRLRTRNNRIARSCRTCELLMQRIRMGRA